MKLNLFLFSIIFLTACTGQPFEKEDTVAVLSENEIKVEEILWQFSLEDNPEAIIVDYLKQEIVIQEAGMC
ncbi:hypothetical protein [Aquibacillus saliphilus]|uniref:hypothetical protein n=1 Tax=Aquibacillus saliphilus TaxID=1909422 RepID=UPI001CEFFE21|nr:hypothetical protein [Aquibacillus saliphilus]